MSKRDELQQALRRLVLAADAHVADLYSSGKGQDSPDLADLANLVSCSNQYQVEFLPKDPGLHQEMERWTSLRDICHAGGLIDAPVTVPADERTMSFL